VKARFNIFCALDSFRRGREWGRGAAARSPELARSALRAGARERHDLILRDRAIAKHLCWAAQGFLGIRVVPRRQWTSRKAERLSVTIRFLEKERSRSICRGARVRERHELLLRDRSRGSLAARSSRRFVLSVAAVVAVVAGTLLLVATASALSKHTYATSFEGSGSNALSSAADVAVEQASHDVYVTDPANFRVEKFDSAGHFVLMFGGQVDKTKVELRKDQEAAGEQVTVTHQEEDLCTAAAGDFCQPGSAGILPGQFNNPEFVAVDNSGGLSAGDVYVTNLTHLGAGNATSNSGYISKFDSAGHLIASWENSGQLNPFEDETLRAHTPSGEGGFPGDLAVDESGNLLFVDFYGGLWKFGQFGAFNSAVANDLLRLAPTGPSGALDAIAGDAVRAFSPSGADLGALTGPGFTGPPTDLALDRSNGQLYVADGDMTIHHYDGACEPSPSGCTPSDSFGGASIGNITGLAVDESSGVVYAADATNDRIDVFTPTPFLPDVATSAATEPAVAGATIRGEVDPAGAGEVTGCKFEYVDQEAFNVDDVDEVQSLTFSGATGGTFTLSFQGQSTATTGIGEITADSNTVGSVVSTGTFTVGEVISGPGIPTGTTIETVYGNELILSAKATETHASSAISASLSVDASAEVVQSALQALSTLGAGNVEVTGEAGGPYTVAFTGARGHANVPQISADSSALTPSGASASLETITEGGDGWGTAATSACEPATHFSGAGEAHADISGLSTETTYHYRLSATNAAGTEAGHDRTFTPHFVIGLSTEPPIHVSGEAATLTGSLLGDGTDTHYFFEWGKTTEYGHTSATPPGIEILSPSGPSTTPLSFNLEGLTPNNTYHYRVVAESGAGKTSDGEDQAFTTPPNAPQISGESTSRVHSDSAQVHAEVNPGSGDTVYHVEYVDQADFTTSGFANATVTPMLGGHAGEGLAPVAADTSLEDLAAGTTYHYRFVAQNVTATTKGTDRTFTTPSYTPLINDPCPNAHVRQQTGAALLLDCRSYELVSAAEAGGYDVESDLIPGQFPYGSYPEAEGRVLYGVHDGGIPGTNHPTNRDVDPYIATRGENGWSTSYVGIPANNPFSAAPFSSVPSGADADLETLAFGGPEGCSPCFEGGYTGVPIHLPDGNLVQGMVASPGVPEPLPSATPDGYIAKDLSANGEHFVFGSTSRFAPGGNSNGEISIYDRNLKAEETKVVSNDPAGTAPLECLQGAGLCNAAHHDSNGIAELAISKDGSHILLAQKVATDADGNVYWHLYMDVNDSPETIDLTPGAADGVLFDGMTADGSKVFFTTRDALHTTINQDSDTSADIYLAELTKIGGDEKTTLTRITTGSEGTGNTDSCAPPANSAHVHWNTVEPGEENCGAVAIGGGGGVSSTNGTIYFLSPEQFAGSGSGTPNAPNLYRAGPADGYATHFVATLESIINGPNPPKLRHSFAHDLPEAFAGAAGLTVEHSSGDLYVLNTATNTVEKFDSSGNPVNFTEGAGTGANQLSGEETPAGSFEEFAPLGLPTELAVNQSNGDLYVPDLFHGAVDVFSSSGKYLSQIGGLSFPSGVAVNSATGDIYVTTYFGGVSVFESSGNPISSFSTNGTPASVAVDPTSGDIYVTNTSEGGSLSETVAYDSAGESKGTLNPHASASVAVDPSTGDVYVDEGTQIAEYNSSANPIETLGTGDLTGSLGLAIDPEGNLYATNSGGGEVALFTASLAPSPLIDNPAVLDSVSESETRHTADFQVTPDGAFAAFPSTLALASQEEETAGRTVLYRYDASTERLACVSCSVSGAASAADSSLASNGLSLSEDGSVFFTSADALAAADTDNQKDAYEWEPQGAGNCQPTSPTFGKATGACLALISAGTSAFDSGLLGVSANGKDTYFFTRDSLAPQDQNGPTMKIYDAREGGGFPYEYPPVACKASDECHGASSPAPGPLEVGSGAGSPHNYEEKCKKGLVRRQGKCVRKHKSRKHKRHARAGHSHRGRK
jgi:DNA-binding beta-propeller fold protein YncE